MNDARQLFADFPKTSHLKTDEFIFHISSASCSMFNFERLIIDFFSGRKNTQLTDGRHSALPK